MPRRLEKLEADVAAIKIDIAVLKADAATRADIAKLEGAFNELKESTQKDLAESKVQIILWVVGSVVLGQLLSAILQLFK